jgi:hypothetical protein
MCGYLRNLMRRSSGAWPPGRMAWRCQCDNGIGMRRSRCPWFRGNTLGDVGTMYRYDNRQDYDGGPTCGNLAGKECSPMETVRVYVGEDDNAVIRCTACGRKKTTNVAAFKGAAKKLKVTCPCGASFMVAFEMGKHYRKSVFLMGEYRRVEPGEEAHSMEVKDISIGGIGIRACHPHHLMIGDIINVCFELDDSRRSFISRNAVVRNVKGMFVGAEFCDNVMDKDLAFYVLP